MTEDEMVGWHHQIDEHGFEQTLGVADGQGGLVCCSPWDCKELDTTGRLNWGNICSGYSVLPSLLINVSFLSTI